MDQMVTVASVRGCNCSPTPTPPPLLDTFIPFYSFLTPHRPPQSSLCGGMMLLRIYEDIFLVLLEYKAVHYVLIYTIRRTLKKKFLSII